VICKCPLRKFIAKNYHRHCSSNSITIKKSS
jgi:hypothetical protein